MILVLTTFTIILHTLLQYLNIIYNNFSVSIQTPSKQMAAPISMVFFGGA